MKENIILDKSKSFAIRVIKLYEFLTEEKKEFVLSKQLLRSGTSIGANMREAQNAVSSADFINKASIALKEAGESEYWLELLNETDYLTPEQFESIYKDCNELNKLLIALIKTTKNNKSN